MDLRTTLLHEIARRQASLSEICTDLGILDTAGRKRALSAINRLKREKIVELARYPNGRAYPNGIRPHLKLVDKSGSEPQPAAGVQPKPKQAERSATHGRAEVVSSSSRPVHRPVDFEAKAIELAGMLDAWTPIRKLVLPNVDRASIFEVVRRGVLIGALACIDQRGKRCEPRLGAMVNRAAADFAPSDIDDFLMRSFGDSPTMLWALLRALESLPTALPGRRIPWHWWEMPRPLAIELMDRGLRSNPPLFSATHDRRPAIAFDDRMLAAVPPIKRGSDRPVVWVSDLSRLLRADAGWRSIAAWAADTGLTEPRVCAAMELGRRGTLIVKAVDLNSGKEFIGPVTPGKAIAYSVSLGPHPEFSITDATGWDDADPIATSDLLEVLTKPVGIDDLVELASTPRRQLIEAMIDLARAGEVACVPGEKSDEARHRYVWSGAACVWNETIERDTIESLTGEMALEHSPVYRSRREARVRREGPAAGRVIEALNRETQPIAMPALAKSLGLSRERIYQILASLPSSAFVLVTCPAGRPVRYLGAQRALQLGVSPQDLAEMRKRVLDTIAHRPVDFKGLVDELGGSELLMGIALAQMQEVGQLVLDARLFRRPVLVREIVQFCDQWRSEKAIRSRFAIQSKDAFVSVTSDRQVLTTVIAGGLSFWAAADQASQIEPPSPAVVASVVLDGDTRTATRFRELIEFCREWRSAKEIEKRFGRYIQLQVPQFVKRGLLIVRSAGRRYGGKKYLARNWDAGSQPA